LFDSGGGPSLESPANHADAPLRPNPVAVAPPHGFAGFRDDELAPAGAMTLDQRLAATERSILEDALRRHNGNRSAAGRELGVSPRMMNYRLNRAGIQS